MMKVGVITKYFYPSLGGVERYVYETSSRLAKRDYSVKVMAPSASNQASFERLNNIEVLRFPTLSFKRFDFSFQMYSYLRKARFDIVHFHTFEILCRALRFGGLGDTPYFITTHGLVWENPRSLLDSLAKSLGGKIMKNNFANASKIFCVSRMDCRNVKKITGNGNDVCQKLIYLPSGVDVEKFRAFEKAKIKERHGHSDKIIVTQVARFSPKKGQHVFLEAISQMEKKISGDCIFVLAGFLQDEKYYSSLLQRARKIDAGKRIRFLPNVTDEQLLRIYMETDIFVLPSMAEGFPLSILEAWASKSGVIASSVGGIPFFVKDGQDCILIPPNNSDILSQKIMSLVKDDKFRKSLSDNGYERALKEFSWENVVKVISKEYDLALG